MEFISGSAKVFGLLGDPVEHSLSPKMHNAAFKAMGMNNVYIPFRVKSNHLAEALEGIRALNIQGVNITAPHKEAALPFLDKLSEDAALLGAVNTVKNEEGCLIGHNTDGAGMVRYLKDDLKIDLKDKKIIIVGAGGAAKSVALSLCKEEIKKIILANRNSQKAEDLADLLHKETGRTAVGLPLEGDIINSVIDSSSLLIYTLPTDVITEEGNWPFDPNYFPEGLTVIDLRYYPKETVLMRAAGERGLSSYNGLGMLLYQGVLAFKIFTGKEPPLEVMKAELV